MSSASWETPKSGESSIETVLDKKAWHQAVDTAVEKSQRENTPLSVIFIDVNHFKDINDSLGHLYGDRIIDDIKELLAKNVRLNKNRPGKNTDLVFSSETDFSTPDKHSEDLGIQVGHLGGDEFGILSKLDDRSARAVSERLHEAFEEYTQAQAPELNDIGVSVSMGVCVLQEGMTASDFLHYADREMFEDKLRQLPPLTEEQRKFLVNFQEGLSAYKIRLRDIGKYLLLMSRDLED
jgi:GGDEF domain-containing protein